MAALLKKGTGDADRLSISGKDALSYSYQIYGFEGDDVLKGGKKNDFLSGGKGNDSLYSGIGNDVLFGGTGKDTFIFNTALGNSSIIRDFNPAEDKIQLDMSVFSSLSSGSLNSNNFVMGSLPTDVNDYLIYDADTGTVSYDEDGSGTNSSSVLLTQLSPNLALSNENFLVTLPSAMQETLKALGTLSDDQSSFSVSSKQIYTKNSLIPAASQAMNAVFTTLFGAEITISQLNITTYEGNTAVSGLLSNGQRLTVILGTATAVDYAISGGMDLGNLTSLDFLKGIGLDSLEFVLSSEGVTVNNPTLGSIGVSGGATVIGAMDLSTSSNQAFKFMSDYLHIDTLVGTLSLDPLEKGVALTGEINTDITFIKIDAFSMTETQIALSASLGVDLVPSIGLSNTIEITGYDPTQSNEPTLALTGGVSFDPKSVTISANIDAASAWNNPFGFQGAIIRNLGFQVGATYITPWIDNIGFVTNVKWGDYDIDFAASIGITDPEKVAFTFTLNKEISALKLFAQMNSMALSPSASTLINYASPLFDYIPFTIVSIDTDNNGALNPLVSFVPFPTSIGSYSLTQGMGIAGQVKFFGVTGTMALQVNSTFTAMTGSLTINNLDLDWLTISGIEPGKDLTASFDISATHQYLQGDGKIVIFGQTLAQAKFMFSPTQVSISEAVLALGPLSLEVAYLNADLKTLAASGKADITMLGYETFAVSFNASSKQIDFTGLMDLGDLDIKGNFVWNLAASTLSVTGDVTISGTTLSKAVVSYSNNSLAISGELLGVKVRSLGNVTASVQAELINKVLTITVTADVGAVGDIKLSIAASDFKLDKIGTALYDAAADQIGELPAYIASAVTDGVTDIFNSGTYVFTSAQANNAINKAIDKAGSAIKNIFGGSKEHNESYYDTLNISKNWEGNGGYDVAFGNGGNEYFNGWQANDILDGGAGNDTLRGQKDDDLLYGGDGNDTLAGGYNTDTVYGGFGNDELWGYEENHSDGGDGTDQNDLLYGGYGNDSLYGGKGADTLYGDGGNDRLDGCYAEITEDNVVDYLYGGLGNDSYYIHADTRDSVIEMTNEGTDWVSSIVGYTLPANVENLTLTGSSDINAVGNTLNNVLMGNSGDNILVGYAGLDTLTGGSGNDVFRLRDLSKDTIKDFSVTDDFIQLDNDVFTKFTTTGKMGAWNFQINSTALGSNDYLIYNKTTGELFYDTDGNGPAAQTPIALLSTNLALTNADFWII